MAIADMATMTPKVMSAFFPTPGSHSPEVKPGTKYMMIAQTTTTATNRNMRVFERKLRICWADTTVLKS